MKELADEQLAGGYKKLDEEELIEFVLQYDYTDDQLEEALKSAIKCKRLWMKH